MLGMSEYQLDLMFEYIDLKSNAAPHNNTEVERMVAIRKILLAEARDNEDRLDKIGKSLESMRNPNAPTWS